VISHDRRFLERVGRTTVWLDRGRSLRLDRGFEHFEAWRDEVLEAEELEQHKLGRAIEREEHWLRYGVTARRKRNMRRLSQLKTMRADHRGHRGPQGRIDVQVAEGRDSGRLVIEAEGISKSFGKEPVVRDFSIRINRGDCLGIIGPNGAGKTTLLKMLIGELQPDTGYVRHGSKLDIAVLDQRRDVLDPDETLAHYLTDGRGDSLIVNGEAKHVTGYMKDFLFQPEQARTPIRNLSGGEKARLVLARILSRPSNLLILDEPTNDLDMETLDLLQELVASYPGTVILISHDRDFLDRTVGSVLAPASPADPDGRWIAYAGGYTDMLAQRGEAAREKKTKQVSETARSGAAAKPQAVPRETSRKLSYKQKFALESLPGKIGAAQEKLAAIEAEMADPALFSKDPDGFAARAKAHDALKADIEAMESQWLELEMLREEIEGA
jgi:ATP-binding cassette subfamily F protein uup